MKTTSTDRRIAVVGVSALFPGSTDKAGFWKDIYSGTDRIGDVPESHWLIDDYYDPDPKAPDKTYAKRGAFLGDVDFDALSWGVPPSILPATDTSQLLALIVANRVLQEAAGDQFETMDRSRISVILGVTSAQELLASSVSRLQRPMWVKALRESGIPEDEVVEICDRIASNYTPWQESTFPGLLGNVVAGRIANRLDLGGTNCVTDAACASTFSSISMGISELMLGDSDLVIAGGVDTLNDIFMFMCFSKTPALSPTGDCRPFSAAGDGTMLGEGLGMVALKRLEDAERDGDGIYGVLTGVGTSSDGRSKSVYAPVSSGQAKALNRAYEKAEYSPRTVELVEAHGTGTVAGDAAEFGGLEMAFGKECDDTRWCALGSVKSQIGHTKAAAGAAGLFKTLMSIHHKVLPPTIKVDAPNPKLELDSGPFYLSLERRPWVRPSDHPRRGSVSSFGFGGSNFHIAVEEYTGTNRPGRLNHFDNELVLVCGANGPAVAAAARELASERPPTPDALRWIALRSQAAYDPKAGARLAVLASSLDDLASRLTVAADRVEAAPEAAFGLPDGTAFGLGEHTGEVAFLFPGQGSQRVGMGSDLATSFDACIGAWDRAAELEFDGTRLHDVVFPKPGFGEQKAADDRALLTSTQWAQPAIGCASLAHLGLVRQLGIEPAMVAGHSFGELTALHAAEAIDETAFLRAARLRGERMNEAASSPGSMLALSLPLETVNDLLERSGSAAGVANHNHPTQVVVSGPTDEIEKLEAFLSAEGIDGKRLPVATAFHSTVVSASCAPFAQDLDALEFHAPALPVFSGVRAQPYSDSTDEMRQSLAAQIASPIDFVGTIRAMHAAGARTFIEVGPGSILTGLTEKILDGDAHVAVALERKGKSGTDSLLLALAKLCAAGVPMQLGRLFSEYQLPADPADHVPARMPVAINGSNYGKPYPPVGGTAALPKPNPSRPPAPTEPAVTTKNPLAAAPPNGVHQQAHSLPAPAPVALAPVAAAPALAAPQPQPGVSQDWLATFRETQRRTAEVQAMYQAAAAQSHAAYLQMAQASLQGLAAIASGLPAVAVPVAYAQPVAPAPVYVAPAPAYVAPAHAPIPAAPVIIPAPAPVVAAPVAAPAPVPVAVAAAPAPAPVAAAPQLDVHEVMLEVVAESTGYPPEMLSAEMSLEGDLGIDSIKRVEILSSVQEKLPGLPGVDAAHMGSLETLGEIVDYMRSLLGETAPAAAPTAAAPTAAAPTAAAPTAAAPAPAAVSQDVHQIMLDVVADSTGYPADMLGREMALEGDLGIDSIKRVEILSSVQERVAGLGGVDAAHMGSLQTLGEIVDYIQGLLGAEPPAATNGEVRLPFDLGAALGRFDLEAVPAPANGLTLPGLHSGPVYITADGNGLNELVAIRLRERHIDAHAVEEPPAGAERVVELVGLRAVGSIDDAVAVNMAAFRAARTVAQGTPKLFVTVQDTGGAFGLQPIPIHREYLSGLAALARTARQEWPDAAIKTIDVERGDRSPEALADALADELVRGGPEFEVGLSRAGERTTLQSVEVDAVPATMTIGATDLVVVSGGARGVTADCVIEWAGETKATFVLLGRTPLDDEPASCAGIEDDAGLKRALLGDARQSGEAIKPAELGRRASRVKAVREIRNTLARIHAAGGTAHYERVSVTDAPGVAACLDRVRQTIGPITGVVHAAGVLADKKIAEKTDDDFAFVFGTKIDGLRALLDATRDDELRVLAVFSSVSARCGNNGQSDYAMANEVLAKVALAESRKRPGTLVKSFGWGPWEGGMVTPALKARFAELGVPMIPLAVGARMFVDEMTDGQPNSVDLVFGGSPTAEALLVEGADQREERMAVHVDRGSHPYLSDHAIAGVPVVPVVTVADWFVRAARLARPGFHLQSLDRMRVLKGIRLEGFDTVGDEFEILCTDVAGTRMQIGLELRSSSGTLHYRATATMAESVAKNDAPMPQIAGLKWGDKPIYGDVLFHGTAFQVIESLDGVSEEGLSGRLKGVRKAEWPIEPWALDVAALDGGLQMALLVTERALGGPSLPTSIESLRTYRSAPNGSEIRCTAVSRSVSSAGATTDVFFMDEDGQCLASMVGVKTHLLPPPAAVA